MKTNNHEAAIAAIHEGLNLHGDFHRFHYYLTAIYLERGSYNKAYEHFEKGLIMNAQDCEFLFEVMSEAKSNQNILELIDLYR